MLKKTANNIGLAHAAKKVVFGTDNIVFGMRNRKMYLVIVSSEASFNTQKLIQDKANTNNVDVIFINEINDQTLSKALGKGNVKVIGISDVGFAKMILKTIKE